MTRGYDRELGLNRDITRRDFLSGVGVAITGSTLSGRGVDWAERLVDRTADAAGTGAPQELYYPPTRLGMRGSHPGSFEVGHRMRDGASFGTPERRSA